MQQNRFLLEYVRCFFFFTILFGQAPVFGKKATNWLTLTNKQLVVKKVTDTKLDLVDIEEINKNIKLDIRYATNNNFVGKKLYSKPKCFLRTHVAKALNAVQKELEAMGLGLKVYDGYRPFFVQKEMYKCCTIPGFVAKPTKDRAKHPRGTAVDVTLIDKDGNELFMPTEFDAFTHKASRMCRKGIPKTAIENREVLGAIMVKHGFIPLPHEWWHFDFYDWKSHAIIDKTFDEIEAILKKRRV